MTVLDSKLFSNDDVGDAKFEVSELVGLELYYLHEDGSHSMKEINLLLWMSKQVAWEVKHAPMLYFGYLDPPPMRCFDKGVLGAVSQYLNQYDADETDTLSHIQLTSMLGSIGSTTICAHYVSICSSHDTINALPRMS